MHLPALCMNLIFFSFLLFVNYLKLKNYVLSRHHIQIYVREFIFGFLAICEIVLTSLFSYKYIIGNSPWEFIYSLDIVSFVLILVVTVNMVYLVRHAKNGIFRPDVDYVTDSFMTCGMISGFGFSFCMITLVIFLYGPY